MEREKLNNITGKFSNIADEWLNSFEEFKTDETLNLKTDKITEVFKTLKEKLKNNYPFHHPCYAGQMLKPPHPVAIAAYSSVMKINPNNHALDGGPATADLEKEAVDLIAKMFGFEKYLGHLTTSGTIANLEALWVSRQLNPNKSIAYSDQSHYTHSRMCEVLKIDSVKIKSDKYGRMSCEDLEEKLKNQNIGTVVVTLGTTALGALDPLDKIIDLSKKYNFRIHVDSAYAGFYSVLKQNEIINGKLFNLIKEVDSVVIDPHKHGLQPYGCGCIIFSDPEVGKFYVHDSPYTYFTSKDLHLGEISLECSRSGASAAALWATLKSFPLEENEGFGNILKKTRQAGINFSNKIKESQNYILLLEPELDIVCYFPKTKEMTSQSISEATEKIFDYLENHPDKPLYLAKLKVNKNTGDYQSNIIWDTETMTVLRSCLMKPEHLDFVDEIINRLEEAQKYLKSK